MNEIKNAISPELAASWAKALGHPNRIRILDMLLDHKGCMCGHIADALGCAQSTLSQHLKILKEAGVIKGTVDGPRVCYCVDHDVLLEMSAFMKHLVCRSAEDPHPENCC